MFRKRFANRLLSLALAGASVLVVVPGVMLVSASPALAHYECVHHPSDPDALGSGAANTTACLRDDHTILDVCDRDSDGHLAYARVTYADSAAPTHAFYDTNGAEPGCSNYSQGDLSYYGTLYYAINICVQYEGCGSPMYRRGWGTPTW